MVLTGRAHPERARQTLNPFAKRRQPAGVVPHRTRKDAKVDNIPFVNVNGSALHNMRLASMKKNGVPYSCRRSTVMDRPGVKDMSANSMSVTLGHANIAASGSRHPTICDLVSIAGQVHELV